MMRLKNTFAVLTALVLTASLAYAGVGKQKQPVFVPQAMDLQAIGEQARQKNVPVLLMFSASHCAYCVMLEEEILKPMIKSGDYDSRVLIYKVMLDDGNEIRDFQGRTLSALDYSVRHRVYVTPTMLFLGASGKELSERILGINTVEMFGGRVDSAIDTALQKLRNNKLAQNTN